MHTTSKQDTVVGLRSVQDTADQHAGNQIQKLSRSLVTQKGMIK